jgi:hypothetical protein
MAEDLQPVGGIRAEILARPQDADLAPVVAAGFARTAVALEVTTQVVQKPGITHFDTHAVSRYRKKMRTG